MAIAEIHFSGSSIGLATAMNVILPDREACGKGPYPVFYLLHGLSDDHTIWLRRTSIERYMSGIPMIVVMPTTARGFYSNAVMPPGLAYEDHLIKDIVPFIDDFFPTIRGRNGRVIGGLSMGGYGAIKTALKYPKMFCSAVSHSGVLLTPMYKPEKRNFSPRLRAEFAAIFGKKWRGGENDPVALAKKCPKNLRPALRIDCGTSDFLLDQNREFHAILQQLNYPHQYEEFPGDHNWAYWDIHVQEAIAFHCKALGIGLPNK